MFHCFVPHVISTLPGTPWKFNIVPENIPFKKESSLPTMIFSEAMSNSGGVICLE